MTIDPHHVQPGTIISFTYMGKESVDRDKQALVLHPNWNGKMHALDMKRMTPAEARTIWDILDPQTRKDGSHPYPLVNDILRRMDPAEEIKNPMSFYVKFCKPFLRSAGDVYRTYFTIRVVNVQVVKKSQMAAAQVQNPLFGGKPLFGG